MVFRRSRNDQRSARLVNQDGIDLIDNGEGMAALHHFGEFVFHIVAQIIEAVFIVGAVGDVAGIGGAPVIILNAMHDDAKGEPEKAIDLAHPFGIAPGEIIIDRNNMHALARQRIEIAGEGGHQSFAFARAHFGNRAFMQHHAANELHIEMPLSKRPLGRFAHSGESGHHEVIQSLALGNFGPELRGASLELLIAEASNFGLQRVDRLHLGGIAFQTTVIGRAENLFGNSAEHH